jgi:hypothetical protein
MRFYTLRRKNPSVRRSLRKGGRRGEGTDLVNVRKNTTTSDGSANERVELFVSTNGELQVTRGDTLDAKILRGVTYVPTPMSFSRTGGKEKIGEGVPASSRTSAVRYSRIAEA